jgi:pilus assembly protein Flp/PilA
MCQWCCHKPLAGYVGLFFRDRRAVTSLEYALVAVLIAVAIFSSVLKIGPELSVSFNQVGSEL